MKKTKLTRLIAVFLSLMMLGSTFGVGSYAADASSDDGSSTVSYDIADVQDLLNAESYTDYAARTADVPRGGSEVKIDAVDYNKDETDAKVEVVSNYNGASGSALLTPADGTTAWDIEVPATGKYAIDIEYTFPTDGKSESILK